MNDSDLWRDLAAAFAQSSTRYEFDAVGNFYTNQRIGEWQLVQNDPVAEFAALARRGASRIATGFVDDLTIVWLEALWKRHTTGPVRIASEAVKQHPNGLMYLRSSVKWVFQASSRFVEGS